MEAAFARPEGRAAFVRQACFSDPFETATSRIWFTLPIVHSATMSNRSRVERRCRGAPPMLRCVTATIAQHVRELGMPATNEAILASVMAEFDARAEEAMAEWKVPAVAIAVVGAIPVVHGR